jgi:hypothetical protein
MEVAMREKRRLTLGALALTTAMVMMTAVPAMAGSTSSGQWTYTRSGVPCTFSGIHSAQGGYAYGKTNEVNTYCGGLALRHKYQRTSDGAVFDSGLQYQYGNPAAMQLTALWVSTSLGSSHRAQNNFDLTWSPIQQPHSF